MVTYNQENFIDEAIRSVILQKFEQPYEIIIGDDCSTDDTLSRCIDWKNKYPDVITIVKHEKNTGLQQNYLDCFSRCKGEYIAICEGDDFWSSKHKLRKQVEYMDAHRDCNICFHRVVNLYMADNTKSLSNGLRTKADTTIEDLSKSNYISNLSVMYRNSAVDRLPDWLLGIHSPDYVIHMLYAATGYIHYINEPMAVYRQHASGIWSGNVKEKRLLISINSRKKLIEHYAGNDIVVENLVKSYTPIAISLALYYDEIGEETKYESTKTEILSYNKSWDKTLLERQLEFAKKRECSGSRLNFRKILKTFRAYFSKIIPVPRIKK